MESKEKSADSKQAQLDAAVEELLHPHRNGHKTSVFGTALRHGVANSTLYRRFRAASKNKPASTVRARTRRGVRRKTNDEDRLRVNAAVSNLLKLQHKGQKSSFSTLAARFGVAKSTLYMHFRLLQAASPDTAPKMNKCSISYILTTPACD